MSNRKGFTIIEMLIVIAIIGIVLSVAYPSLAGSYDSSKENDRIRHEYVINKALKQYYALTGRYPNQGHDTTEKDLLPAELLLLTDRALLTDTPSGDVDSLFNQTGVALKEAEYTYTYVDIDGDGEYEISSLHVEPK